MDKKQQQELSAFYVDCTGQVESGEFGPLDSLYCRYSFQFGPDWTIAAGLDTGLSQISKKRFNGDDACVIWNFPIDIKFKTTNPYGWPRIAISVYGVDFLGRDVVRGYGSALVPLSSGQHIVDVPMYVPLASSELNQWISWIWGNPPEFFDSKFVTQSDGREVTRVQSTGSVRLKLNISTKGMQATGYAVCDQDVTQPAVAATGTIAAPN